jgi:hypothetical protein
MRFLAMRKGIYFGLACLALAAGTGPALAFRVPEPNAPYPTQHQMEARNAEGEQPWAMSYSDQAAQRLGVKEGQWEAFGSSDSAPYRLKGGIDTRGAVLRLTW